MTTGLRSSGVGACVCARHEIVRAQGIGDLQKGERLVFHGARGVSESNEGLSGTATWTTSSYLPSLASPSCI